jgi:hypothetical protein
MADKQPLAPSLPNYSGGIQAHLTQKQQGPLMKIMGKMLAAKLPGRMKGGKISSQSVTIKHQKKVRYW